MALWCARGSSCYAAGNRTAEFVAVSAAGWRGIFAALAAGAGRMGFARSLCSDSSGGIVLGWCCWHYEYHILLLFGQSVTNRIADKIALRVAANYEPQATAVELSSLTKVLIRGN